VRGTPGDALQAAVLRLSDADRGRLMRVSAASALAEIESTPAVVPLDRAAMNAAMKRVYTGLPDEDVRRLRSALVHLEKATDDEACWAARTFYARALDPLEPTCGVLVRGFIAYSSKGGRGNGRSHSAHKNDPVAFLVEWPAVAENVSARHGCANV
jgi:hypothetical protein